MADLADLYPNIDKNAPPPSYTETTMADLALSGASAPISNSMSDFTTSQHTTTNYPNITHSSPQYINQSTQSTHYNHLAHSSPHNHIVRNESHNYPDVTSTQPQSIQEQPYTDIPIGSDSDGTSAATSSTTATRAATREQTAYQLLVSDLCYQPSLGECCLATCCPYIISGCNNMKVRNGSVICFFYGCCALDCCCCLMSQDIQRRLGAPVNGCLYLTLCHLLCRGLILSKERMAIKEWILAGKPRYTADGVVMR